MTRLCFVVFALLPTLASAQTWQMDVKTDPLTDKKVLTEIGTAKADNGNIYQMSLRCDSGEVTSAIIMTFDAQSHARPIPFETEVYQSRPEYTGTSHGVPVYRSDTSTSTTRSIMARFNSNPANPLTLGATDYSNAAGFRWQTKGHTLPERIVFGNIFPDETVIFNFTMPSEQKGMLRQYCGWKTEKEIADAKAAEVAIAQAEKARFEAWLPTFRLNLAEGQQVVVKLDADTVRQAPEAFQQSYRNSDGVATVMGTRVTLGQPQKPNVWDILSGTPGHPVQGRTKAVSATADPGFIWVSFDGRTVYQVALTVVFPVR